MNGGLKEEMVASVKVRVGDSLMVPMGDSNFICTYMGDRWCIHETKDDSLQSVQFLPHLLVQVLNDYANKKNAEAEGETKPDIDLVKPGEPTKH